MWEKSHRGRAGTGQHRQGGSCSGGASRRQAVWLQHVSEKGEEKVTIPAGTLLQVQRGLLCFKCSRENLPGARPLAALPRDHLLLVLVRRPSFGRGLWWMGCCPGSGRGAFGVKAGAVKTIAQNKGSEKVMSSVGVRGTSSRSAAFHSASFHHFHDFTEA